MVSSAAKAQFITLTAWLALGGCMTHAKPVTEPRIESSAPHVDDGTVTVRYQVADIDRAIAFYTQQLGFQPGERAGSAFASVRRGHLRLILGGPGSSGSRAMPDGRQQVPGGWNRILIYVEALSPVIERLRAAGVHFRNDVETGPGGKQILIDDPDGNPIELHQS
jgi:glyoxylase I family protein